MVFHQDSNLCSLWIPNSSHTPTLSATTAGNIATSNSDTEKEGTLRVIAPARVVYQDHRNDSLLKKIHANPLKEHKLTAELKEPIEKIKAIIPNFNPETIPAAKRPKTLGVLDENYPEVIIPKSQWKSVESALTKVALKVILENPVTPPACEDLGWNQGQIKIAHEKQHDFYSTNVFSIKQACLMSPFLFPIVPADVLNKALASKRDVAWNFYEHLGLLSVYKQLWSSALLSA